VAELKGLKRSNPKRGSLGRRSRDEGQVGDKKYAIYPFMYSVWRHTAHPMSYTKSIASHLSVSTCISGFLLLGALCIQAVATQAETAPRIVPPEGTAQVSCYDKGGTALMTYEDRNGDGRFEIRTFFERGRVSRQEEDTDEDGRMDRWQFYEEGTLVSLEEDRSCDGKRDLKVLYGLRGEQKAIEQDQDGDGRFELVQRFDQLPWTRVVRSDMSGKGKPEITLFYRGEILAERMADADQDGLPDWREVYRLDGSLKDRCEFIREGKRLDGPCPVHFSYGPKGSNVLRAEIDRNGDGRPQEWFYYESKRLARVEEDSDGDGRVDVWETYDGEERLVRRERDVDGDGKPDISE
jgi:hypothetical protein